MAQKTANEVAHSNGDIKEPTQEKKHLWDPMVEGVKWAEKYSSYLEKVFNKLPDFFSTLVATLAVFAVGSALRGEWIIILVTALKQASGHTQSDKNITSAEGIYKLLTLDVKMEMFTPIFVISHVVSYSLYFILGGFLHWYFYVNRRDKAKEWKIQPDKWLSPELERHEIILGTFSLFFAGSSSAVLATYIYNNNPCQVYFQFNEFGWLWFFIQIPIVFVYIDYSTYWMHRLYHMPFFYQNFHKLHHKYKQPTAFSVTAIHPVEIIHIQFVTMILPLFVIPIHWVPYAMINIYNYTHGILDHSGIDFKAMWWQPWQPDAKFHDQHHEFFHCNFGFNMFFWDKLHGTTRKENRFYTEDTYHGQAPLIDSQEHKLAAEKEKLELKSSLNKTS